MPLIAWLYAGILGGLLLQWVHNPNVSHGFVVLIFASFVLWRERKKLKVMVSAPSWAGLPLILLSLLMLMAGKRSGELFLSRVSLLVLLAGLAILLEGWPFFRAVLFPWALQFLTIPLPLTTFEKVTLTLHFLAAKLASTLLYLGGVPVLEQGYMITLPGILLSIWDCCGAIGSILAPLTVAIIYGYLADNRNWVRVTLACSTVPCVVAASGFRVAGTGLLAHYWDPETALKFFSLGGWLTFVFELTMLFVLHRLISRIWKGKRESKSAAQLPAITTGTSPAI